MVCIDVGSTFTKGTLVEVPAGRPVATTARRTSIDSDVMDAVRAVRDDLTRIAGADPQRSATLVCSSAGGGLRIGVVGYEREVTAEAGRRVALSAGGRVIHVSHGRLEPAGVRALRSDRPDIVLLVGGTDGGNGEVLVHNATALARARVKAPVVVAGNADAAPVAAAALAATGRRCEVTTNVVPRIGVIAADGARSAIRSAFLRHVIGGRGLSRGPGFARLVRAATPDAVLAGVEVLAEVLGHDVLVVDIGGATTDVYSVITPMGEDATLRREVVAPLWHARTVEADLGMRWNALGIVDGADADGLTVTREVREHAARVAADIGYLPTPAEERLDLELAALAAVLAVRRHGRAPGPGQSMRPLREVALLLGSGGVLRHTGAPGRAALAGLLSDRGGGWRVPDRARVAIDATYLLFAVGLLEPEHPQAARALARRLAEPGPA